MPFILEIIYWNAHSLVRNLNDEELKQYFMSYHIVCISETWIYDEKIFDNWLPGYKSFVHCRNRNKHGGLVVFVSQKVCKCVRRIYDDWNDCVVLLCDKNKLGLEKPLLMLFTYISPKGSLIYTDGDEGMDILETQIYTMKGCMNEEVDLLISGDLNARTAHLMDYIIDDSCEYMPMESWYESDDFNLQRQSKDTQVNTYGISLCNMCATNGLYILNGRFLGDRCGEFTCIKHNGKSVVDYMLGNQSLFNKVKDFRVMSIDKSDHFPIMCTINCNVDYTEKETYEMSECVRYKWKLECMNSFQNALQGADVKRMIEQFSVCVNTDIDKAVMIMQDIYQLAAKPMKCKIVKHQKQSEWYDLECQQLSEQRYAKLNTFRKMNTHDSLISYRQSRNTYKNICRNKKEQWHRKQREMIEGAKDNPNKVWNLIKRKPANSLHQNEIPPEDWFEYFKGLLNMQYEPSTIENQIDSMLEEHDRDCLDCDYDIPDIMNAPVTEEEIVKVIDDMHCNKAPGIDGLVIELYKHSKETAVPLLLSLFNAILNLGTYPEEWCKAIICALHKKGSHFVKDNYRGISLLVVCSKIFTKVVNNRLLSWSETEKKIHECQGAYMPGRCTTDHIFSLYAVGQKQLCHRGGRCYMLYIDFSKAFDRVQHKYLWYRAISYGLHGKVLRVLRSMYSQLKSCVRTPQGLTEFFECKMGTRQGCMVSPFLFLMYINEFVNQLVEYGCEGVYVTPECPNVLCSMYADDIVSIAVSVENLQKQINTLYDFCKRWGMKVNTDKTKVMVCRNGGPLRRIETWNLGNEKVEPTSYYKYLGVVFSSRLVWSKTVQTLADQAQKAINMLNTFESKHGKLSYKCAFTIFDKMIAPILLYGSEVWGFEPRKQIEQIQMKFCKRHLGVTASACNAAVLGDCGRLPMSVFYTTRLIKYWLRLVCMNDNRYPKQCYNMLYSLDVEGRLTWATSVRNVMYKYGFGYVWINQGVGDVDMFVAAFKQRLKDCATQDWHDSMMMNERLRDYCTCKSVLEPEKYVTDISIHRYKKALAKLRMSNHSLHIEKGRHQNINVRDRICMYCKSMENIMVVEDEHHFICACPLYSDIRKNMIGNTFIYTDIMKDTASLCKFVYAAFQCRHHYMNSM